VRALHFVRHLGFSPPTGPVEGVEAAAFDSTDAAIPRPRSIRWLIFFGVCLIITIALGTALAVFSAKDRALTAAQRELQNMASVLATKANSTFEVIEHVQANLLERMQSSGILSGEDFESKYSSFDVHRLLKDKHLGLPQVGTFTLINTQGKLFNFSRSWPVPDINVADRRFFRELQSDPSRHLAISEPIRNRATNTWVVQLARKVRTADGDFAGLLLAAIELEQFEKEFQSIVLGETGSISLFRTDGVLLARFPRVEATIGRVFRGALDKLEGRENGTVRMVGGMEGKDRLLAIQRLADYPFFVSAGFDTDSALAGWRRETAVVAALGILSAGLVAVVFFLMVRQLWRQDRWSRQRLTREKHRLDTAINNMIQGLLLFDSSERIVVCNRRYIEMYRLDPDIVKPGCSFRELIAHRQETGSFAGNIESYRDALLRDLGQGRATELIVELADGRSIQIVNQPLASGGWVATHEDITDRKRAEARIRYLAHYDALTGLPNRTLFREQLEQQLNWVHRGSKLAVLYLDLDHFKSINDTLGHPIGDELLTAVASRLRECVAETDTVARLGGDEFAIIQTAVERTADVTKLAGRVLEAISEPFDLGGHHVVTETSIGIAMAPNDGSEPDRLLKSADLALYGAKANGRGSYHFFEPVMDARAKAKRALEFDLREAIMCGGFELHYQPLVSLRDNRIVGCEALLRWRHPVRGVISPAEFIPVAEETGLINPLGEWVLNAACAEAATWPQHLKVAVNVSPIQFKSQGLGLTIVGALARSGLAASRLEVEITETVLMRDDDVALKVLHQLRGLGIGIAMDDFGTGFSSLSYLQRFPFDKIKIDRCFITNVAAKNGSIAIVKAIVDIARARGIRTTAEGVETEQQRKMLRRLGCDEMQGFLISPAKPAAEIIQLFVEPQPRLPQLLPNN
jgi:diguanylate cyclase (GGDEF)-like protein